jgi:hypothetical protein
MDVLAIVLLLAATPTLTDVCNSAPGAGGQVTVNADIATGSQDASAGRLFYSSNGQASWTELPMSRMADPGYESTHMATVAVGSAGTVWYYARGVNATNLATQSPYNAGNTWPPGLNLIALAASDPTGDAIDPEGNWVDLTGAWVGYSADKFYGSLTNNHTSWPLYTFPQPWFIYSIGFVNPEAPTDTYAFSLSYANVPGVFTTGLYLINRYAASYERIGNVDASTSGNRLHLRCNISDLVNHPKFGPWPNTSGYLAVAANTQAIYPIGGAALRDTTAPANYYATRTPSFIIGQNRALTLAGPDVNPRTGSPSTYFVFTVTYSDADSNLPTERTLVIDGNPYYLIPNHHRYWAGVVFRRELAKFGPGWHRFFFRFSDGMNQVTSTPDSFYVVSTDLAEPGAPETSLGLSVRPNPFIQQTNLAGVRGLVVITAADGRVVRRFGQPGQDRVEWDGRDEHGRPARAGVYFAHVPGAAAPALVLLKLSD